MPRDLWEKSSVEEIRERFDGDVERFSHLETGQAAAMDSPLGLELISAASIACCPAADRLLDLGCGAGNFSVKLLTDSAAARSIERVRCDVDLVDLSQPMLDRANERVSAVTTGAVRTHQADLRDLRFDDGSFDIIVAAAVLHHLRSEDDWRTVFGELYRWLRPGGCVWIFDLVEQETPALRAIMWERYAEYLRTLRDEDYRKTVFEYIDREDSPRPLMTQLAWLTDAGFETTEVLHKHACFAAYGAIKSS